MRRPLSFLLLAALFAPASPGNASDPACSSGFAVVDRHAANYSCPGVHPGMSVRVKSAKYGDIACGTSFAFTDQAKNRYLTLPGTCFLDFECLEDVLEELPPPLNELLPRLPTCLLAGDSELEPYYKKNGPPVKDEDGRKIGTLTYAVNKDGINFAIARIDPGVKLDPSLPLYGGPVSLGLATFPPEEAYVYSAPGSDLTANARSGFVHASSPGVAYVVTEGILASPKGGSVMKTNGQAVGMLTGFLGLTGGYMTQPFGPALERTLRITKLKLSLLTAPLE